MFHYYFPNDFLNLDMNTFTVKYSFTSIFHQNAWIIYFFWQICQWIFIYEAPQF